MAAFTLKNYESVYEQFGKHVRQMALESPSMHPVERRKAVTAYILSMYRKDPNNYQPDQVCNDVGFIGMVFRTKLKHWTPVGTIPASPVTMFVDAAKQYALELKDAAPHPYYNKRLSYDEIKALPRHDVIKNSTYSDIIAAMRLSLFQGANFLMEFARHANQLASTVGEAYLYGKGPIKDCAVGYEEFVQKVQKDEELAKQVLLNDIASKEMTEIRNVLTGLLQKTCVVGYDPLVTARIAYLLSSIDHYTRLTAGLHNRTAGVYQKDRYGVGIHHHYRKVSEKIRPLYVELTTSLLNFLVSISNDKELIAPFNDFISTLVLVTRTPESELKTNT